MAQSRGSELQLPNCLLGWWLVSFPGGAILGPVLKYSNIMAPKKINQSPGGYDVTPVQGL